MSFMTQIRDELGGLPIKPLCCRRAYLYGLIYGGVADGDHVTVTFPCDKDAAYSPAEHAVALIAALFSRKADVTPLTRGAHRYYVVSFEFKHAARFLRDMAALPKEEAETETLPRLLNVKCDACTLHFLRGLFVASGTINDPMKSYHLEIKLPDDGRVEPARILLAEAGYEMGLVNRAGRAGLVCKSGESIQEMLAYLGATSSLFDFFNAQIAREIRNNENRATNCVTENIGRAIRAGARQQAAIEYLDAKGLLPSLPPELQYTARLRLYNPDITLSELAELHLPPVTKSVLHRRLCKIMARYEAAIER